MLLTVSPDCLVTTYLYFLIPSPFSPKPLTPLRSGDRQSVLGKLTADDAEITTTHPGVTEMAKLGFYERDLLPFFN